MATFWLLGGQGHNLFTYYCLQERNPLTGALPPGFPWQVPMLQDGQTTYRCLCWLYMMYYCTETFTHSRASFLLEALLHALVAWSLYRLLRLLRLSVAASVGAALLFLSAPIAYEAIIGHGYGFVTISIYLFLLMAAVYLGPSSSYRLPAMGVLAVASVCFYEITGPVYPLLPLLYAAVYGTPTSLRECWRPMLLPIVCVLALFVLYASMTVVTRPSQKRGGMDSFTAPRDLAGHTVTVVRHAIGFLDLNGLLGDALREGWKRLEHSSMVAWFVLCAAAAWWWLSWWNRLCAQPPAPPRVERSSLVLVLVFGVLAAVLPWSLVVFSRIPSWVSRLCYFPVAGVMIAAGAAMDLSGSVLSGNKSASRFYWAAVGVVVLACSLCGAVAMIGIQSWFQQEAQRNEDFAAHLRALVPHPPPAAFFLPIPLCPPSSDQSARTRQSYLASVCPPVWGNSLAATGLLHMAYRRRDISCGMVHGQTLFELERFPEQLWDYAQMLDEADARSFSVTLMHTRHQEHELHSWRNAVLFTMDCTQNLRLVDTIHLEHPDNQDEVVHLPAVAAAASQPDQVGEVSLWAPRPGQHLGTLMPWHWAGNRQMVSWEYAYQSAVRREALWLSGTADRSAAYAVLLPSTQPVHLYFRVLPKGRTNLELVLAPDALAHGGTPFARYPLAPAGPGKWQPVTAVIAPHSTVVTLTMRVFSEGVEAVCGVSRPFTDLPVTESGY